jgi:autotransporter-associated beta strand protein
VAGGNLTVSGSTLKLNIVTNTMPLTWTNAASGAWDTSAYNWKDSAGNSSKYEETLVSGDTVVFDDTPGAGNSTVSLNTTITPANITISNTNRNYAVSGTGRITGPTGLTKNGSGSFTLNTTNDYAGVTTIGAGTLMIGGDGTLYGGASRGTITNNGVFAYESTATQTFYGVMCGIGSVVCSGSGKLVFAVASSYSGDTKVYNGLFQVNHPTLSTNADVYVSAPGRLNLNFTGTNTIKCLHINGGVASKSTYGASGSGAKIIRDDVFSGNGVLDVTVGPPGLIIYIH